MGDIDFFLCTSDYVCFGIINDSIFINSIHQYTDVAKRFRLNCLPRTDILEVELRNGFLGELTEKNLALSSSETRRGELRGDLELASLHGKRMNQVTSSMPR